MNQSMDEWMGELQIRRDLWTDGVAWPTLTGSNTFFLRQEVISLSQRS